MGISGCRFFGKNQSGALYIDTEGDSDKERQAIERPVDRAREEEENEVRWRDDVGRPTLFAKHCRGSK
jgi:hypothetical protein